MAKPLPATRANQLLDRNHDRYQQRLEAIVTRILNRTADKAARNFRRKVVAHTSLPSHETAAIAPWAAPAPDELVDARAIVQQYRTLTDPVRQQHLRDHMTPALEAAGLRWSVTNPFVQGVLAKTASKVTQIADTTRLNVMRIVHDSYEQGLSIPDTAKAIQQGMRAASSARATLIARTEMTSLAAGGSLAAMNIVSAATGDTYLKRWNTAPGAEHPRHEDYDGLDGQEVGLDELFDVGDSQLAHPGDFDGPPEETCNCRCALSFVSPTGQVEEAPDDLQGSGAGSVPASAHYRAGSGAKVCETCSYYGSSNFHCGRFDADVEPQKVCDEWAYGVPGEIEVARDYSRTE